MAVTEHKNHDKTKKKNRKKFKLPVNYTVRTQMLPSVNDRRLTATQELVFVLHMYLFPLAQTEYSLNPTQRRIPSATAESIINVVRTTHYRIICALKVHVRGR